MRSSASIASILTLFALGAAAGCGGTDTNTSAGGGGAGTTSSTTGGTGGMTGGTGGVTGGSGGGGTGGATGGTGGATGGSGGGGPTFEVVDCAVPDFDPPADPNATCEVTMPGTAGVLLQGTILTSDKVFHKGQVLVGADGKIACVDCDCSASAGADQATVVTCAQGVISPALINAHDHITFDQNPPKGANTPNAQGGHQDNNERYAHRHEWRKGQNGHTKLTAPSSQDDTFIRTTELRFVMGGATAAASAGGKSGLLRNVDAAGLGEGITFAVNSETFPLGDSGGETDIDLSNGCSYPSPDASSVAGAGDAYLPHISEGINDAAHNEFICTSSNPPPGGANNLLGAKTSIIHAVGLTAEDVGLMRIDSTHLIWSPRSNVDLYGNTANVTMFDTLGVPIALGTDWLPSGSMNMLRELRCADELNATYYNGHFTDYQLWRMVTVNAALAVGQAAKLGDLKQGLWADISIFNAKNKVDHRAVVGADIDGVVLVMRGGKILYGDAVIVDDLRPDVCEAIDVCTIAKRACVSADVGGGTTLATLVSSSQNTYPLFFCPDAANPTGLPHQEPSCVPYRAEYPNGPSATDNDGDGIPNAMDNCPDIFNPTRPMDAANPAMPKPEEQADFDGDGKGDVCDACPLDAQNGCSFDDIDGDGKTNDTDNCPKDKNVDQADTDQDGKGNLCDNCPNDANPGNMPCPATAFPIKAVRDPSDPNHPAPGTPVLIQNMYVTAVDDIPSGRGFFMQDTTLTPFSGIFVFTGNVSPGVQVGNKVDVQGIYKEYNGQAELDTAITTITDMGTTLPFMPIDIPNPATIATGGAQAEGYESMLLHIGAVSVSKVNADNPPDDFDEFAVSPGNLRIDDQVFGALDNTCALGKAFTGFTGVLAFTFSNSKILPRNAADIGLLDVADPNYCKPFP